LTVVVYYPSFLGVKKVQQAVGVNKTAAIIFGIGKSAVIINRLA
jgi:hypothetical protein